MSRASYQRNPSGQSVVYTIEPIPASKAKAFGSGRVMLALQAVAVFFVALIICGLLGVAMGSGFLGVLAALGIAAWFVYWSRGRNARLMGRRQRVQVTVDGSSLRIAAGGGEVAVARDRVRRLTLGNTYAEQRSTEPDVVRLNTSTSQHVGATIAANVDAKLPAFCYSLCLHHDNESTLVADGLDELTANNLLDDLCRDLELELAA